MIRGFLSNNCRRSITGWELLLFTQTERGRLHMCVCQRLHMTWETHLFGAMFDEQILGVMPQPGRAIAAFTTISLDTASFNRGWCLIVCGAWEGGWGSRDRILKTHFLRGKTWVFAFFFFLTSNTHESLKPPRSRKVMSRWVRKLLNL